MMARPQKQVFQTRGAATYLSENGVKISPSYLEKTRLRGTDDPRDRGPDFYRDPHGICIYTRIDLDRYAETRLAALRFRGTAPPPPQLRV
jgi:hypothetical protein